MSGHFSPAQQDILLQPIASWRVFETDGQSHLAGWDVIAHLNRLFGFEGWDKQIVDLTLVYENVGEREIQVDEYQNRRKTGRKVPKKVLACSVGYRCTLRLTVRDTEGNVVRVIEDAAMGTATNQRDLGEAHDLAVKSAVTYALKRCAKDLGDQFGLSLYNRGQEAAVVGKVAVYGHAVSEHEGHVHADGIDEGDQGFGQTRKGDAPEDESVAETPAEPEQPVESDGPPLTEPRDENQGEGPDPQPEPAPVREPAPARPKNEKPEATAPEPKTEVPALPAEEQKAWLDTIAGVTNVEALKEVWKTIANHGQLDILVTQDDKPVTLREVMVARVRAFEEAA
jgi:hypothetical protein